MKRFRVGMTQNHLHALMTVYRLVNATSDAVAKSQNMPSQARYWRRYLNDLKIDGLLDSRTVYYTSKSGRGGASLGAFFSLTKQGAEVIGETLGIDQEGVFYPHGGVQMKSPFQFPHRALLVQLLAMILAYEKANPERFEVIDLLPEFRYIGSNRLGTGQKITRVEVTGEYKENSLIPDALLRFNAGGTTRLAAIEFHRETDSARIVEQLKKHTAAVSQRAFSNMFEHPHANHVLSVYEESSKLKSVIQRIHAGEIPNFSKYAAGFHFATLDDVCNLGIDKAFYQITGAKSAIF